jgi:hypothetical protein
VVEVGVRQEDDIEALRVKRKRISVVLVLVARALEEPAVEKNAQPVDLHEMARACDRPGRTAECDLQSALPAL